MSYNGSRLNGVLAILTFVDHSLSLIISFLDSQASFALTTTNTCSLKSQAPYSQATSWGWPYGLAHNSRIHLYKSFYEQVFLQGSKRKPLKRRKHYSPTSRKARIFKAPSQRSYKIHCRRTFFYKSFNARKKKNLYQQATYKKSTRFAVEFFLSYEPLNTRKAKDLFANELHTRAMEVRESQGSRWVRQGWSITTTRGCEKVEKRKEKKKTKEGEKVAPAKATFRVS